MLPVQCTALVQGLSGHDCYKLSTTAPHPYGSETKSRLSQTASHPGPENNKAVFTTLISSQLNHASSSSISFLQARITS